VNGILDVEVPATAQPSAAVRQRRKGGRLVVPTQLFEIGQRVLASQPFSQLVGAKLDALEPGRAELSILLGPTLLQQHGAAHGGVVSYLADNALTFAGGSLFGDAVTAEFKLNFVHAADGQRLVARAQVVGQSRTQAICRVDVFAVTDGAEKLVAVGLGTVRGLVAAR
jgi:uncharacterized protein (TIGR00369 family)